MPPQRSASLSAPRRTGIMGTDTRQRSLLDWTPLSLHHLGASLATLRRLCPSPEPGTYWRHASACTCLQLS